MTTEPEWIEAEDAARFHEEVVASFGGQSGVGDRWSLEFALNRPRKLFTHGQPDLPALAAAYAQAIVRNHPFEDGNPRTALVLACLFLGLNGLAVEPPEEEAVVMTEGLAAGEVSAALFASWLRKHSRP